MSDYTDSPIVEIDSPIIETDSSFIETSTAEERVHDITKERHALELRAEVINLVAGRKAERKGLSDRLEIGIESATDTAYGKEDLHVGGGLTEEANTAETTGLMLSTTVYGKLNLNYYSDTLITAGGMLEQYTGGEFIAAGMSDNLLGGGGIRIRGADLRMNAASVMEEKVSTLAIDGLVAECFSTACEREEGNAIYSVGFASYKGAMEVLTGTTIRPMCRALFGVRTKNRGGGGSGGDSNEPSSKQPPTPAEEPKPPPKPPRRTNTLLPAVGSSINSVGDLSSTLKRTQSTGQLEDVVTNTDNAIHLKRSKSSASFFDNLKNTDESTTASKALPDTVGNQQLGNEVLPPPKDYPDQSYTSRVSGDMSDSPLNQAISDDMAGNNRSLDIEGIDKEAFLKKLSDDQEALKKEYNNTATLDKTKRDAIEEEQIILSHVIREMGSGSNPESVFTHAPYDISEEIVNKARDKVSDAIEFSRRSSSQIDNENPYQNIVLTKNNDTTQKRINKSQEELIHVVPDFQSSPDYTSPPRTKTAERPNTVYNGIDYNLKIISEEDNPSLGVLIGPAKIDKPKGKESKLFSRNKKIKNNLDLSANQIDIEKGKGNSNQLSISDSARNQSFPPNDFSSSITPRLEHQRATWESPYQNVPKIDITSNPERRRMFDGIDSEILSDDFFDDELSFNEMLRRRINQIKENGFGETMVVIKRDPSVNQADVFDGVSQLDENINMNEIVRIMENDAVAQQRYNDLEPALLWLDTSIRRKKDPRKFIENNIQSLKNIKKLEAKNKPALASKIDDKIRKFESFNELLDKLMKNKKYKLIYDDIEIMEMKHHKLKKETAKMSKKIKKEHNKMKLIDESLESDYKTTVSSIAANDLSLELTPSISTDEIKGINQLIPSPPPDLPATNNAYSNSIIPSPPPDLPGATNNAYSNSIIPFPPPDLPATNNAYSNSIIPFPPPDLPATNNAYSNSIIPSPPPDLPATNNAYSNSIIPSPPPDLPGATNNAYSNSIIPSPPPDLSVIADRVYSNPKKLLSNNTIKQKVESVVYSPLQQTTSAPSYVSPEAGIILNNVETSIRNQPITIPADTIKTIGQKMSNNPDSILRMKQKKIIDRQLGDRLTMTDNSSKSLHSHLPDIEDNLPSLPPNRTIINSSPENIYNPTFGSTSSDTVTGFLSELGFQKPQHTPSQPQSVQSRIKMQLDQSPIMQLNQSPIRQLDQSPIDPSTSVTQKIQPSQPIQSEEIEQLKKRTTALMYNALQDIRNPPQKTSINDLSISKPPIEEPSTPKPSTPKPSAPEPAPKPSAPEPAPKPLARRTPSSQTPQRRTTQIDNKRKTPNQINAENMRKERKAKEDAAKLKAQEEQQKRKERIQNQNRK